MRTALARRDLLMARKGAWPLQRGGHPRSEWIVPERGTERIGGPGRARRCIRVCGLSGMEKPRTQGGGRDASLLRSAASGRDLWTNRGPANQVSGACSPVWAHNSPPAGGWWLQQILVDRISCPIDLNPAWLDGQHKIIAQSKLEADTPVASTRHLLANH